MGEVFRARDRVSGEAVAVKVLLESRSGEDRRFTREAAVLSELRHPGIVRYVAHGVTDAGEPYLAMEWLEGEDLSCRLGRRALMMDETLTLLTRVAGALAAAHARGVVHRDLKPSNLFLVGRDIGQVKVLDFGIARRGGATPITKTGAVVGTPGYMAPEQVRSGGDVDARADVFALGCVLFECLTGTPLFTGEHLMAILAKILFQEAPRLCEQAPDIPPALDALCARMLAKERDERPCDGAAVADALGTLDTVVTLQVEEASAALSLAPPALTGSERRVLSVVLLGQEPALDDAAPTLGRTEIALAAEALYRTAEAHGGRLEVLADSSAIVSIAGATRIATDQAAQAARCALALHALCPERLMALTTGRAEGTGKLLVGDAIDRAAQILSSLASPGQRLPPLAIDEVTSGLLDARFEVVEGTAGLELRGERVLAEGARTLLGKPTPYVGRDWELRTLDALVTECIEESMARAVLITAPAGMGKSRLAYELTRRVRQRGEEIAIWSGRIDSLRAGSTFGLLGQVLRSALGIHDGETLEARRQQIRARVAEHVAGSEQGQVSEFLGEIVGTPFPDDESVPLRAARQDAQLMGDQMRRAWVAFLQAESDAQPVLVVLEDLHWGDLSTVRFVDAALRELRGLPWVVLALARPEVHDIFPKLWADRGVLEIRLKELSHKASERLVRQVLGDRVEADTIERIVTRAEGHAFYLEELIRAVAEGRDGALPETVLGMVEARLAELDPEARRVLRAASVFGEVFWQGGVAELLGSTIQPARVEDWLGNLMERELLVRRPESRVQAEKEFAFRHALLREGAYAMLTEEDRTLGHRLAGEWLSRRGKDDAMALAEHFERGEQSERAAAWYQRAAEHAFKGNDLEAAIARAERAMVCGASDEMLGRLQLLQAKAHYWRGENHDAMRCGLSAMRALRRGSAPFCEAAAEAVLASARIGDLEHLFETSEALLDLPIGSGPPFASTESREESASLAIALSTSARMHLISGNEPARVEALLSQAEKVARTVDDDPAVTGQVQVALSKRSIIAGDVSGYLELMEAARSNFERAGNLREACVQALNVGYAYMQLGAYDKAERVLREALLEAERLSLSSARSTGRHNLGLALARQGKLEEGRTVEEEAVGLARTHANRRLEFASRIYLALILTLAGEVERAAEEARAVTDEPTVMLSIRAYALATLAEARRAEGCTDAALSAAQEAMGLLVSLGGVEEGESFIRLIYAEVLQATGHQELARSAITAARDRLLANAAKIGDLEYRRSFLANIPENARTLKLARDWLGRDLFVPEAPITLKH
jgi:eukaryotic-like serine/threonine-protein kinase